MSQDQFKELMENATPDQRLALAKGGVILAVLQEQVRMGFSQDEIASVLSMREDNSINEEMKFIWLKRLATYHEAMASELGG